MSAPQAALNDAPLVQRESGIVVPAHLATAPETTPEARDAIARDPDGRRRVVLTKETRKLFVRLAGELGRDHIGIIAWCRTTQPKAVVVKDAKTGERVPVVIEEPIPGACGKIMVREDEDGPDPGYGCECTRIHFLRSTPGQH